MPRRILILEGHPDPRPARFCHALADAYAEGAAAAGHELRRVSVAALDVPLLADRQEWETGDPPAPIRRLQDDIAWAGHLVVIFPLWLGGMPARMRGVLEQTFRPHFGSAAPAAGGLPRGLLRGKTVSAAPRPFGQGLDVQPSVSAAPFQGISASIRAWGHPLTRRVSNWVR